MNLKLLLVQFFLLLFLVNKGQNDTQIVFKKISCAEKRWVIMHPFVAKRARDITNKTKKIVEEVKKDSTLSGNGNGDQIDAFRHTYWMAALTQEIGWRKAKRLGVAHEKGNYRDYKKRRNEDGIVPDKVSSEMDLFNNNVGIDLGRMSSKLALIKMAEEFVLTGKCKIIKVDKRGNYLDREGIVILQQSLKGKWKNGKCLIDSDTYF